MNSKSYLLCECILRYCGSISDYDDFEVTTYNHMGATIVDSILQAGLNYNNVVYPRVKDLLVKYPAYKTTTDFLILINSIPLRELVRINNKSKLWAIFCLSWLLFNNGIQTEEDAAVWLRKEDNSQLLLEIEGIGYKTVDYFKGLVGHNDSIAIDRHLFGFLKLAGIEYRDYKEAHEIYCQSSQILKCNPCKLDKAVWKYMTAKANELEYDSVRVLPE